MKKIFIFLAITLGVLSIANAQYLRGEINTWGTSDFMILNSDYGSYYSVTIQATSDITDGAYKVDQIGDWSLNWGFATDSYNAVTNTSEGQMRGSLSGDSPTDMINDFQLEKYYTFKIEGDDTWWNRRFVFMETDGFPVTILNVSDNSDVQTTNDVTVDLVMSGSLSSQETVYLRYTTDLWSTSDVVACTGSGTAYSGIISGQSAGSDVEYYIFTSSMDNTFVLADPNFATLKGNNNGDLNYTYTVVSSAPYTVISVVSDLNENDLDDAIIDIELFNDTFEDATIDPINVVLNNAPTGLSVLSVVYTDDTNISITLDFDGTDFLSDYENFSITISDAELTGNIEVISNVLIIYDAIEIMSVEPSDIVMWEGGAEDLTYYADDFNGHDFGIMNSTNSLFLKSGGTAINLSEDAVVISAKMNYRIYKDGDIPGAFVQQNLVFQSVIPFPGSSSVQFWRNMPPDEINLNLLESLTEGLYFIEVYFEAEDGFAETSYDNNSGLNYIAEFTWEEIPGVIATPAAELNSSSLNTMTIGLVLENETFVDATLEATNFILNNAPANLTIDNVSYTSDTEVDIILAYDNAAILTQIDDFSITVLAAELTGGADLQSNNMTILAEVVHQDIYLSKVSMWEGTGDDTWYDEVDFDTHDFGSFNSSMFLYFKSGQVFTWKDDVGEIVSATMNYRIYLDGDTPPDFTQVDLPFYSEWVSGLNTDELWWNDSPDEIDTNILEGLTEGTYFFEVYYEAVTGDTETLYRNNDGDNYIATFTYTTNPILVGEPAESMDEENLDGMEITLSVTEDTFADAMLDPLNFSLNNAPAGLTIDDVTYVGPVDATVLLAFDGTNFDLDVEDFTITVDASEFALGIELTSNNMIITAIDESVTISTHLLTSNNIIRHLGDNDSYWLDMEIGQLEWNGAQIGIGTIVDDPESFTWYTAEWYEDGEDENKKVHSFVTVPNLEAIYYYAGRVRNTESGQWFYANSADWGEADTLNAQYMIMTAALEPVVSANANELDGSRINLDWTADMTYNNVIVLAKATDPIISDPEQGINYAIGELIDGAEVIYKGNAGTFIHTGLSNLSTYNYSFYSLNNDYYSTGIITSATTTDEDGCTFDLDLGDDISVCGGSSILINTELLVSPYGDTLTVYFNSSTFPNFDGLTKVYMHSGAQLLGGSAWDYTVGNWGDDDGVGEMTMVSPDLWMIQFNPFEYYNFPEDSELVGISIVFRNDDGTVLAVNPDNLEDFFIDMTVNPPVVSYSSVTVDAVQSEISEILWSTGANTPAISVSTAGEYSVIATDRFGCIAMDTIDVGIYSLPYVELGNDQTLCDEGEVTLDAGEFESYAWNVDSTTQTITVIEAGTYIVTVTDMNGCTGFDVVNINLVDSPIAEFSYLFTDDFTVEFSDSSEFATIYSWDFDSDGSEDSDVAGDVSYTYGDIGQYAAVLTVSNECSNDEYSQIIYVLNIDSENAFSISVYPNPVSETLNIEVPNEIGNTQLQLVSIEGKLLYSENIDKAGNISIDVKEYTPGLYILKVITSEKEINTKIIIK